jgi:hypothetical protein
MTYGGMGDAELAHALLAVMRNSFEHRSQLRTARAPSPYQIGKTGPTASAALVSLRNGRPVVLAEAVAEAATDASIERAVRRAQILADFVREMPLENQPEVWICAPLSLAQSLADRYPSTAAFRVRWIPYS